jgi:hypothetical protein
MPVVAAATVRQQVEARLAPLLGAKTAQTAVRLSAKTWLAREADAVGLADLPRLCQGLRPMLTTFLGAEAAGNVVEAVLREVR